MGKYYVVAPGATSSLIRGIGGLLFHFILSKSAVLDKINGKPRSPLPQKSTMGKWQVFSFCAALFLIRGWVGEGGAVMGVCCFILFCPRLKINDDRQHKGGLNTNRNMAYSSKSEMPVFEIQTNDICPPPRQP